MPDKSLLSQLPLYYNPNGKYQPYTSDHSRQAIKIEEFDIQGLTPLISVSGATWNLLNFGQSSATSNFSNNPYDLDESFSGYVNRKKEQLDHIYAQISADDSSEEYSPVDFMLLQEADLFRKVLPLPHKTNLDAAISKFKTNISALGWVLVLPAHTTYVKHGIATLFNGNLFDLVGESGLFATTPKDYCRGYETRFIHKLTGKRVAITNVHLERPVNYIQSILDYQYTLKAAGALSIIGGDTNHAQRIDQIGLIGGRQYSTEIGGRDTDAQRSIRTREAHATLKVPKRYDGFFACPSAQDSRIRATELKGVYFGKSMVTKRIYANLYNKDQRESTLTHSNGHFVGLALGMPYMPNRLKMFLKTLELAGKLITTASGAPDIEACKQHYPELCEQAEKHYVELNETYNEAVKAEQAKRQGVIHPTAVWLAQKTLLGQRVNAEYQECKKSWSSTKKELLTQAQEEYNAAEGFQMVRSKRRAR